MFKDTVSKPPLNSSWITHPGLYHYFMAATIPDTYFGTYNGNNFICSKNEWLIIIKLLQCFINEKNILKNVKVVYEESREWEWFKPKALGQWEENECFLEKDNLNCMYIRHQHMKHSCYKIMCFKHFPFDQELWHTDNWQRNCRIYSQPFDAQRKNT